MNATGRLCERGGRRDCASVLWAALIAFAMVVGLPSAHGAIIDQSMTVGTGLAVDLSWTPNAPYGQVFVPSVAHHVALDLSLSPTDASVTITVRLRVDDTGAMVPGSEVTRTLRVPEPTGLWLNNWVRFDFAELVDLVPGQRYVIEASSMDHVNWGGYYAPLPYFDEYPAGHIVLGDRADEGNWDLAFQTVVIPEPSMFATFAASVAGLFLPRRSITAGR
jgi:hypothetical protein